MHFKWTAPAAGRGSISFYAALGTGVVADTNGLFMDSLNLFAMSYPENVISDLPNESYAHSELTITPTCASDNFSVEYQLLALAKVTIVIQNIKGGTVKTFFMDYQTPGVHTFICDIKDLPNGIYFIRVNNGLTENVRKVIVDK